MREELKILYRYTPKWKIIIFIVAVLANALMGLATALVVQKATEMQGTSDISKIIVFGLIGTGLYAYVAVAMLLGNIVVNTLVYSWMKNLKSGLLQSFLYKSNQYTNSEMISIMTNDMELLYQAYLTQILIIPFFSVVFIAPLIYMMTQNLFLGSIFVIGSLSLMLPQIFFNKKLNYLGNQLSKKRSELLEIASDDIKGRMSIVRNGSEESVLNLTNRHIDDSERATFWFSTTNNIVFSLSTFLKTLAEIVPFVVGLVMIGNGSDLKFAVLLALFSASQQLKQPLQQVLYAFSYIQEVKEIRNKVFGLLIETTESAKNNQITSEGFDELVITDLSKSFADKQVLSHFSLVVPFGYKVLIKGESGCGKSTLLKLISSELSTDSGEIYMKKEDKKIKIGFPNLGFVEQEPFIFNGTVRYNLSLGQGFDDDELLGVLQEVNLSNEIGLNMELVNNGENLSGGQKIRLELARFLLRKKKLLLVDEVTASLDNENAKKIRDLIFSLPITIIEVAHHIDDESRYNNITTMERRV